MYYGDKREARVNIMYALKEKGWNVFGYKPNESDSMVGYYSPADWDGIAEKNGFVLVVDNYGTHYSGYKKQEYIGGNKFYKSNARIEKLKAMMNDEASTENEKASCAVLIEKEQEKSDAVEKYRLIETYPTFQHGNPGRCSWHIEKDGQIIAKGTGVFACYVGNDHIEENRIERDEKINKLIARFESAINTAEAFEPEVIKVPKQVIRPVEKESNEINEGDILSFSYHGHYWTVTGIYTVGEQVRVSYELLGSEKRGYPRKKNAKRYYQLITKLHKEIHEGKVKVYTLQEVTEYTEKTVFTKTKRAQKVSDSVQISGDVEETAEEIFQDSHNTNQIIEPATKRQLWALHCATKLDTRDLKISKDKASELITQSKAGHNIKEILQSILSNEDQSEIGNDNEMIQIFDAVEEFTGAIMIENNFTVKTGFPTQEIKNMFVEKLADFLSRSGYNLKRIKSYTLKNFPNHKLLIEGLEALTASKSEKNSVTEKANDQTQHVEKISKQIVTAQTKLENLSGDYLTNTWKRQQEENSREMKRESLRFDIALLEYLKEKAVHNSMTELEQKLLNGAMRDQLHNYSIQTREYAFPDPDETTTEWFKAELTKRKNRLTKAGIYTLEHLIQAVEEYKIIKSEVTKPIDPTLKQIKKLELEVKFSKIPGYFPTPSSIVEKLLDYADIQAGESILEPSAGNGNILDGIATHINSNGVSAKLDAVEWNYTLRSILSLKGYNVVDDDFLKYEKYNYYDKILMNPPFEKNQDIKHVRHAYDCLKDGGKLVAIMSPHFTFANDKDSVEFRNWLDGRGYYEKLPEGSFKESGTGVATVLVVIDKVEEKAAEAV